MRGMAKAMRYKGIGTREHDLLKKEKAINGVGKRDIKRKSLTSKLVPEE